MSGIVDVVFQLFHPNGLRGTAGMAQYFQTARSLIGFAGIASDGETDGG
jgi:hypothetical protein